jgi:deazaflavin-dependent oxidoreductase (nitroreductase family)
MPKDFGWKAMNAVHRSMLKASRGRFGWQVARMPTLLLTTIGRRSGKPHSVMLTSPVREGDTLVVVASRGGADHHPAWFLNLRDNPDVEVKVQGEATRPMRARVADADERARLWPQVTAKYEGYAGYQSKTDREIPLVLLDPREPVG